MDPGLHQQKIPKQDGCHVVAQTQGYHLVCIWGGLFKFQGGGVVLKFDSFRTGMQFFVFFYASNDLLCC